MHILLPHTHTHAPQSSKNLGRQKYGKRRGQESNQPTSQPTDRSLPKPSQASTGRSIDRLIRHSNSNRYRVIFYALIDQIECLFLPFNYYLTLPDSIPIVFYEFSTVTPDYSHDFKYNNLSLPPGINCIHLLSFHSFILFFVKAKINLKIILYILFFMNY